MKEVNKKLSVHDGKYRYDVTIRNSALVRIEQSERVFLSSIPRTASRAILYAIDKAGYTTEIDDHGVVYVGVKE